MIAAAARARLLRLLAVDGYRFTTTTPLTHARYLARRPGRRATGLRDVFGWNMPFERNLLPQPLLECMGEAGVLLPQGDLWLSAVRVASIRDDLFLHSLHPTVEADSVFFGPDTYRFARLIEQVLATSARPRRPGRPLRVLDVGCGSGAGGVVAARCLARPGQECSVTLNDINPKALAFAAANAQVAGVTVRLAQGDALDAVEGEFDLVICNPPYMADAGRREYRDGGAGLGRALGVRIVGAAARRLAPNGRLIMYTGVAMVDGSDPFLREVAPLLDAAEHAWSYQEIDPDVFGEELDSPAYAGADRIAAVSLVATRLGA